MKKIVKVFYIIISILFLAYLALPSPDLPPDPPGSIKSNEPADTEEELKKAYFTNLDRNEIMNYFDKNFNPNTIYLPQLISYRLNYPPENAQTIIRDQTRSTFLEEIVHPFRESLYINGFKPSSPKDEIIVENKEWLQKITFRYVPSSFFLRMIIGMSILVLIKIIYKETTGVLNVNKQ